MSAGAAGSGASDEERTLRALVSGRWEGSRVTRIDRLAGDASTRRYARLRIAGGDAPPTAVAMLLPPGDEARQSEELAAPVGELRDRELPFVGVLRYLASLEIAVPELLLDASPEGVLLLEDLGDEPLAGRALSLATSPDAPAARVELERLFAEAVDLLGRIALGGIERPDPRCVAFRSAYDRDLIARELAVVASHGLAPSEHGPPADPARDPELGRALARLGDAVDAQPRVLMHRDFHAWNLQVDAAGAVRVLDFQDALPGPAFYDLASLCTDRDSDRFVDVALEQALVNRHASSLARLWPAGTGRDEIERDYWTAVAYRTLRVIGRFRFLAIEKGKPAYLRFLPRMARQTVRALEALDDRRLLQVLAERSPLFAPVARPARP